MKEKPVRFVDKELTRAIYRVVAIKAGATSEEFKNSVKVNETSGWGDYQRMVAELILEKLGGQCDIRGLVPNFKAAHPPVSAVMNRLLRKAQRIGASYEHTPLLEVSEDTEFELKLPQRVQAKILYRSVLEQITPLLPNLWKAFKYGFPLAWPLRLMNQHCYFHSKVEDDIEDFMYEKCMKVQHGMETQAAESLKLQMNEFMSGHHSIPLSDFIYQLQYYVFKAKNHGLRMNLHKFLSSHDCVKNNWPNASLHIPFRKYYTQAEEERAINYILHKYSDFIDRRRGSIPGEDYNAGGVLLEKSVVAVLKQEKEDAEKTTAEEEEQRMEDLGVLFTQKLKESKKDDGDKNVNESGVRITDLLKAKEKKVKRLESDLQRKEKEKAEIARKHKTVTEDVAKLENQLGHFQVRTSAAEKEKEDEKKEKEDMQVKVDEAIAKMAKITQASGGQELEEVLAVLESVRKASSAKTGRSKLGKVSRKISMVKEVETAGRQRALSRKSGMEKELHEKRQQARRDKGITAEQETNAVVVVQKNARGLLVRKLHVLPRFEAFWPRFPPVLLTFSTHLGWKMGNCSPV
jgi:hypothetical protein